MPKDLVSKEVRVIGSDKCCQVGGGEDSSVPRRKLAFRRAVFSFFFVILGALELARIIGMSHWHPARSVLLFFFGTGV
jgi:hypothetical protein